MRTETLEPRAEALFDLPCACQNLRRATRVVTRIYDQELAKAGIEITPFGLLTALDLTGEANQKRLSAGFAMDSTTLTRTLRLMLKQGWIRARRGKDKRERLFSLTRAGRRQLAAAQRRGPGVGIGFGQEIGLAVDLRGCTLPAAAGGGQEVAPATRGPALPGVPGVRPSVRPSRMLVPAPALQYEGP